MIHQLIGDTNAIHGHQHVVVVERFNHSSTEAPGQGPLLHGHHPSLALSHGQDDGLVKGAQEGGIAAILGAMRGHESHPGVQEQGRRALANLALNAENQAALQIQYRRRHWLGMIQPANQPQGVAHDGTGTGALPEFTPIKVAGTVTDTTDTPTADTLLATLSLSPLPAAAHPEPPKPPSPPASNETHRRNLDQDTIAQLHAAAAMIVPTNPFQDQDQAHDSDAEDFEIVDYE